MKGNVMDKGIKIKTIPKAIGTAKITLFHDA
jgi:hypothetical protein